MAEHGAAVEPSQPATSSPRLVPQAGQPEPLGADGSTCLAVGVYERMILSAAESEQVRDAWSTYGRQVPADSVGWQTHRTRRAVRADHPVPHRAGATQSMNMIPPTGLLDSG
jgi:hypothetical protein